MPLQFMLTAEAQGRMHSYADRADSGAKDLVGSPVGQIVGSMNRIRPAGEVVADLVQGFEETVERLSDILAQTEGTGQ